VNEKYQKTYTFYGNLKLLMKLITSLLKTIFQWKSEVKKLQLVTVYHILPHLLQITQSLQNNLYICYGNMYLLWC